MNRPFFPLFFKDQGKLQYLSMEQRGELLTALFDYAANGSIPKLDSLTGFAFEVFRERIDTSLVKYEETCQKRREAAKKGAAARWGKSEHMPNGITEMPNASVGMPNDSKNAEKEEEGGREKEEERKKKYEDRSVKLEEEGEGNELIADAPDITIKKYFFEKFNREPTIPFLKSATQTGLPVAYICAAIDRSTHARIPESYATNILRSWANDGVPNDVSNEAAGEDAPLADWEREWMAQLKAHSDG